MTDESNETAIEQRLFLYCTLCDTKQFGALAKEVFSPDGIADYGLGPVQGAPAIVDHLSALSAEMDSTSHSISNLIIEVDGNCAGSSAYVLAWGWLVVTSDRGLTRPADYATVAVFEDTWSRGEDGWRITKRIVRPLGPGAVAVGALPGSLTGIAGSASDHHSA
jgi:SnoaL-like domain